MLLFNKVKDPEPFFVNPPEPEIIPLKLPMELLFNVRVLPDEIDIPPLPDNPAGLSGSGGISISSGRTLTLNNSSMGNFSGIISGSGGLTKNGSGS